MTKLLLKLFQLCAGSIALGAMIVAPQPSYAAGTDSLTALSVDNQLTPLGLDDQQPVFGWQMRSTRSGAAQQAYELQVASSPALLQHGHADLWDSGRTISSDSVGVPYAGMPLTARARYYWQVKTWNDQGKPIVSTVASWETGLMERGNWQAKWLTGDTSFDRDNRAADPIWIGPPTGASTPKSGASSEQFRLRFSLSDKPVNALLLITARPTPAAWINGHALDAFSGRHAAGTNYPWGTFTRIDVTKELNRGDNVFAAQASTEGNAGKPALLALLVATMPDGSIRRFRSDEQWKVSASIPADWYTVAFDDSRWTQPEIVGQIGDINDAYPWPPAAATEFRKRFATHGPIISARLYATALGAYLPYLNGQRVGTQVLAPGWTDYKRELPYQTYDVTKQVQRGQNTLALRLGDGWYASGLVDLQRRYNFGAPPLRLMAQLEVHYADGSSETIATDGSWQSHVSPIVKSDLYDGESYDARLADADWSRTNGTDEGWHAAALAEDPGGAVRIVAQAWPPIEQELELHPKSIRKTADGEYLVDMGQDMVGVERIHVRGPAGSRVRLQFGEVLTPEGAFYRANMRTAAEEDDYILSGKGDEVYEPSFTYHGFRYVQVLGYPGELKASDLTGIVFHTAAPQSIVFHSSNPIVDKLVENIRWGQRGNFMSVPTDCPQRDERLGWMGDAQVFWRTASYNMDLDSFSRKFAEDMRIAQTADGQFADISPRVLEVAGAGTPGWADAGLVIPWTAYLQYGDKRILEESWPSMQRWMQYLTTHNPSFIVASKGYGDWLSIDSDTPKDLIGTAFWAYDDELMIRIAQALGKTDEVAIYQQQLQQVKQAFQAKFISTEGVIGNGSQTSDVLALRMGLVPEALQAKMADALVADLKRHGDHLTTGFLGTPYLLPVLSDSGNSDEAFRLLLQVSYPSWGYMIEHGATTMWERWNGNQKLDDPSMNSFNHYAYGSVGEWLYRYVAGIDASAAAPAFHRIVLRPHFDPRIGSVDMRYDSAYGPIRSTWHATADGTEWMVSIPANTAAEVHLPKAPRTDSSGKCVADAAGGGVTCQLGSGSYTFRIN